MWVLRQLLPDGERNYLPPGEPIDFVLPVEVDTTGIANQAPGKLVCRGGRMMVVSQQASEDANTREGADSVLILCTRGQGCLIRLWNHRLAVVPDKAIDSVAE